MPTNTLKDLLNQPGEHAFLYDGPAGVIEGICLVPAHRPTEEIAMLGHPHPLQGGSMSNKVVTTLARAFRDEGVASIRFNFRGVGKSGGSFDQGQGEHEDMLALMAQVQSFFPQVQWILAGFSFGSFVTYKAALAAKPVLLFSIAPPIERYDYTQPIDCPWVIFQGDADEVVDAEGVFSFAAKHVPPLQVVRFEDTGHFFHGKLLLLRTSLEQAYQAYRAGA